jgi:hypothetical protein
MLRRAEWSIQPLGRRNRAQQDPDGVDRMGCPFVVGSAGRSIVERRTVTNLPLLPAWTRQ